MDSLDEKITAQRERVRLSSRNDLNRFEELNRLSQLLGDRYEAESEAEDLDEAILLSKEVLRLVNPNDPQLGQYQNTLAYLYAFQFHDTEESEYLDLAIPLMESAIELAEPKSVERKARLSNLSSFYRIRFENNNGNNMDDLYLSIEKGREALLDLDLDDIERPNYLSALSESLGILYEIEGSITVLEEAIQKAQESLVSAQDENIPGLAHTLASLLGQRFDRYGKEEDLKNALSKARLAVEKTPQGHIMYPIYLTGLANHLLDQYQFTGEEECLDEATVLYRKSCDLSSRNPGDKALALSNLGNTLGNRYEAKGDLNDLHESIKVTREALDLVDSESRDRAMFLANLCCWLIVQVEQEQEQLESKSNGNSANIIREAVEAGREAIKLDYAGSPDLPFRLSNLINALSVGYEIIQSESILDEAIQLGSEAQSSVASNHRSLPGILVNLSIALESKCDRTGRIDLLNQAVEHARRAVSLTNPTRPDYASWLVNLSNLLRDRFQATGDKNSLEEAIDHIRNVVSLTPLKHFRRASRMYTLGSHLGTLYSVTGISAALDESIETLRDAIQGDCNSFIKAKCWTSLCGRLASKFLLSRNPEDLGMALSASDEAMKSMPIDSENKASALNTINSALILSEDKEISGLDKAIGNGRTILSLTPIGHSWRSLYLSNLGVLGYLKFSQTKDFSCLDESIKLSEEASRLVDASSLDYATYSRNYGRVLKLRFDEKQNPEDLCCALKAFVNAFAAENSPPLERIRAGEAAGWIMADQCQWVEASKVFSEAVHLITRVSPRSLAVEDQQYLLSEMFGLSAAAASARLMAGHSPSEALNILETGRGVISRLAIDSADELEGLKTKHPDYYLEYERLRNTATLEPLDQGISNHGLLTFKTKNENPSNRFRNYQSHSTTDTHRRALDALDAFEAQIRRELKEFRYFHLTPSPEDCMKLATQGPIICFAITRFRSDALIITEEDVKSLDLPKVDFNNLQKLALTMVGKDRVTNGENSYTRGPRNSTLRGTLETLWKTVVSPVLSEVGMMSKPTTGPLPRIYWVASGFLTLMPLHAAGDDLDFAMNHAVSTYIPTLKALQLSKSLMGVKATPKARQEKLIVVAMPEAPGQQTLDLEEELKDIKLVAKSAGVFSIRQLDSSQKEKVINSLSDCTMVHFACHGYADARNPSSGGLIVGLLPSGKSDLLTVRDLSRSKWPKLRLAYLSACSTARNAAIDLLDESIHIANAFSLVGFPHVIGTLWDADNIAATKVSKFFYEGLTSRMSATDVQDDNTSFDDIVAYALHEAILRVRMMNLQTTSSGRRRDPTKDVLAWAPFLHVGS